MTGRTVADAAGSAASAADPGGLLRAYEAASMYYVQGETMEVIAHHLGVSRSTVSRLLARARQEGVVRVSLVQPGGAGSLEGRMAQVFGVRTHIVPVREGTTEIHRLQQVASVAAARMVDKEIYIFDEPSSGLDYRHLRSTARTIRDLAEADKVVVVVTHDEELLTACADRVVQMRPLAGPTASTTD